MLRVGHTSSFALPPGYYRSIDHEFAYIWSEQSQLKAIPFNRNTSSFDFFKTQTGLTYRQALCQHKHIV
jgi:hypothetical protein